MIRQLSMLAQNVDHGNPPDSGTQYPMPYRKTDPNPPPRNTHNRLDILMDLRL